MTSPPIGRPRTWPARVDAAAGGLAVDVAFYALSAAFAGMTAITATLEPHVAWGRIAMFGYAVAAVLALAQAMTRSRFPALAGARARAAVALFAFAATVAAPLLAQAAQRAGGRIGRAQEEVGVVESGGARLWRHGMPYLSHDAIAGLLPGDRLDAYMPYQPGMALFGLPRAIAGVSWWTDARVWFLIVFAVSVGWGLALLREASGGARVRAAQAAAILPVSALTLAVGGDDLPVLGLCLLALALAARERLTGAGLAVGVAGALKLFAWPVALVLLAFALTRGRAKFVRYAAAAIGLPIVALVPALAVDWDAAVENVVRFPLGMGLAVSPAASPFPGHLIASHVSGGHTIATALLGVVAAAVVVWLVRRPPRNAARAAMVSACGLLAAILLIPATRFGYLLYPAAYACWAPALWEGACRDERRDGSGITAAESASATRD